MRLFKSFSMSGMLVAGAMALTAAPALANEPASTEAQLEQRVVELEAQLESVMSQMQSNATSQTTLEARIAEFQTSAAGDALSAHWNNGIRMDSADGNFKFKIGGRIQSDWATFDADSDVETAFGADDFQTATEFRRARLYVAGTVYGNVGFKAQYDFAGGDADFKDVYMTLDHPCVGLITVGHHYEPFGREVQTSSKNITFMERSLVAQLAPGRSTGVSVANSFGDNWNWRVGAFRPSNSYGDDNRNMGAGEWGLTGRIDGQLWSDDNGSLSGGLSGSYRNEPEGVNAVGLSDELATVGIRGGSHMLPSLSGAVVVDGETKLWGADLAYLRGPWHAMAEYAAADVNAAGGSADLDAWAAQVGYFITGETRGWKNGDYSRTAPAGNYGDGDNTGAVEVAVRYDTTDLDDGAVAGVEMDQWTLGVNWYLNPNTRVMINYGEADYDGIGEVEFFGMRFAIDF